MDFDEADIRGRAIVQHFFSELEKIAYSNKTRALIEASGVAKKQLDEAPAALGFRRHWRGSDANKAYQGVKERARLAADAATSQTGRETQALQSALANRKGDQGAILKRLTDGPTAKQAPTARVDPNAGFKRKAAIGIGLPVAGATGLYAGQQYLSQPKGPQYS